MDDEEIVLFARLKIKRDSIEAAKRAALSIIENSRAEDGCLNYDFHQQIDDESVFLWHETWKNKAAVEVHGLSEHFKKFSAAIDDLIEEPLQIILTKMVSRKA